MSKLAHWFRKSFKGRRPGAQRARPPVRLAVEALEERTVPTIVFLPKYGPEGFADNHGTRLSDVPVYLIFWGSYWQKTQSDPNGSTPTVKEITGDVQSILGGPYLKGLTQYAVNGNAHLAGTYFDTSDWSSGSFDASDLADVVDGLQDNGGGLPETDDLPTTPLYVVVTAPGVQSKDSGAASFNGMQHDDDPPYTDVDQIPLIWLGGIQPNGIPQNGTIRDWYSDNFSHEVAEAITDISGDAIRVSPAPAFTNAFGANATGQEIGDNEAAQHTYRLNGVLTQSLWSQKNGAYAVYDGTSQQFTVTNGILLVQGDQGGVRDDQITLDVANSGPSTGGVRVTLNGEVAQFEAGQITSIQVYTGAGNDTVNVEAVPAGVGVSLNKLGSGHGTLNVSPGAHQWGNVHNDVTVYSSTPGTWSENVYDQAHPYTETYGIDTWSVSRTNAGTFTSFFGSVGSVTLYAGYSANTINVPGLGRTLDSFFPLTIDGGGFSTVVADDRNNPATTTYTLTASALTRAAAGQPVVTINYAHVRGFTVNTGSGPNTIVMDDSNNPVASTYTVTATTMSRTAANGASATINYAQVKALTLTTGSGADVVNVESTPVAMTVFGGAGADTFNVAPSSQKLDGINGLLSFQGGRGGATLTVNDQANPSGVGLFSPSTLYTVSGSNLTRAVYYPLLHGGYTTTIAYAGLTNLTLNAGNNGHNTVNVEGTPSPTTINGGAPTSEIDIAPTAQTLDNINGSLSIAAASANVKVYDQDDTDATSGTPLAYTLESGLVERDALVKGSMVHTQIYTFPAQSVTLYTSQTSGSHPNTVTAGSASLTPAPLTLNSGSADQITVVALEGLLTVDAHGGTLTFNDVGLQNSFSPYTYDPQITHGYTVTDYNVGYTVADHTVGRTEQVHQVEVIYPGPGYPKGGQVVSNYSFNATLNYQNAKSLTIAGGPVDSIFAVQSTPTGMPVAITGLTGSRVSVPGIPGGPTVNRFILGLNGSVKSIRSALTLNASSANDTLVLDDSQATTQDTVTVTPTQIGAAAADQFFAAGGSLTYGGFYALTLNLSHAADDSVQLTPSAATAFTINGDLTEFLAGHGAALNVDLTGVLDALLTPGTLSFTKGSRQPVTFKYMGTVHTH